MLKIAHRINSIADLKKLPRDLGVEIDVRFNNQNHTLYLNHDLGQGDDLEEYLKLCGNRFVIFNIKEAGVEQMVLDLAAKYKISDFFLLDVEFPYLYKATRELGIKKIAARFSEAEPIEFALAQKGFVTWVWIDTQTKLPLDESIIAKLKNFKTCLVSPDRWGRPEDIQKYRALMEKLNFIPDAVMVGLEHLDKWQ